MNPQKNKDYDVRPAPLSMEQLQVQHGALRRPQEAEFVHSMLAATMPRDRFSNEQREMFARCICEGQEHLRMQLAQESKISPSLRDVSRVVHLRNFFETRGKWLLDPDISNVSADMQAMIFALACTYLFRVHASVRGDFEASIARILFPNNPNGQTLKNLISASTLKLLDMSIKPKGVASTVALRENLFCIVVSVSALVPLLIKGPAGYAVQL